MRALVCTFLRAEESAVPPVTAAIRTKARHRWKEVSLAQLLPEGRLSREFYKGRWQKLKQNQPQTPCTRRFFLSDLRSELPSGMSIRLSPVRSKRSKALRIELRRIDDLIIPAEASP